jgi:ferric-dicitrate binding protein FerR (iron transport regulator)
MLLNAAVEEVKAVQPNATDLSASARRVADRLGIDHLQGAAIDAIHSCGDVQKLLPAFQAGNLSNARSLLIHAHLSECSACRRRLQSGTAVLDWSTPRPARAFAWHPRAFGWTFAGALALLVSGLFVYRAYWQVPPGVRAEVQSIDGSAYRISATGDRPLAPGDRLAEGDHLRTSGGAHAVLRLSDGSTVEVNERSVLGVGARGNNMTVLLDDGDVIVQAAKRTSGHLYVKTPDCRVAVTGTVFSVDSGIKGSRVAVLQGTVDVSHAGVDSVIHAGDQVSTNDNLAPAPVEQQIAWSHDREKYLPLLAQFSTLEKRIEQIPFPQPRYSSDLLARVPADTLLYISIPNLGEFLSEAKTIFNDQLKQSPVLQRWWNQGPGKNTADLDALVEKIHQMSQYLGDEIVIAGVKQPTNPGFAIIADVKRSGLDDFLRNQLPNSHLTVLDQTSLAAHQPSSQPQAGGFALVRPNEVVFSNSAATLKLINAQLNAGASGFASGDFGKQIASAYTRGAGIFLAADLHQIIANQAALAHGSAKNPKALDGSGMEDMRYLIAEHREINGQPQNQVSLQFSAARRGIASWLAAPAPMGSLNFVTPNAAIAVAAVSKDPKAIADDIVAMATANNPNGNQEITEAEAKLQINLREDLAATLGGEFLLSLDGPVLPTPSWKAVIEVNDSQRLEQTLEKLTEAIRGLSQGKPAHSIVIQSSDVAGQRFYSIVDQVSANTVAQYTYSNGYMIVAPTRALLMEAMQTNASGNSLGRAAQFRALLPKDANDNYSAVAYQNLTPVLTPMLSQFSGQAADALRQLAADARPTAICARGEQNSIQAESDGHLFGFDFVTLGTLMNLGNHHATANVKE